MEENTQNSQGQTPETPATPTEVSKKFELTTPMAIVIAALIIGLAIIVVKSPGSSNSSAQTGVPSVSQMVKDVLDTKNTVTPAAVTSSDHSIGSASPKVTIIEYSDLECPYCKAFHGTVQKVLTNYPDVTVVYRHFPLDCVDNTDPSCTPLHPKARNEAIAAECAAAQGGNDAFWKFVDEIFAITPSNNGLDPAQLPATAQKIGLNMSAFNTCLSNKTYANVVSAQAKEGLNEVHVQGTPTSVIIDNVTGNKYLLAGAYPYEVVSGVLDKILK